MQAWVGDHSVWHSICDIWLKYALVDLGGSLAVASRGLFATGVSTDLNGKFIKSVSHPTSLFLIQSSLVTYLNSGGKVGDRILAVCLSLSIPQSYQTGTNFQRQEVTCDKCTLSDFFIAPPLLNMLAIN